MTRLNIDIGIEGNPATGDTLRTAMSKINSNFQELYLSNAADGNLTTSVTNGNVSIQPNGTGNVEIDALSVNSDNITSLTTNSSVTITGNGTAGVDIEALSITGTSISSSDSTTININDNLVVDGTGDFSGTLSVTGASTLTAGATIDGISITDNTITTASSNANLELSAAGTGDIEALSDLLLKGNEPFLKIQRTDNASVPGIDFLGQAGTSGSKILFDGTSGSANELIFQTFTVAGGLAEAFRVQGGGAKVTGTLDVDGGISITDNTITSSASNADLELNASGTGTIVLENLKVGTGATVTTILDEDNMASNSATALATQQSIKAYVDAEISGVGTASTGDLAIIGSTISAPSNADLTLTTSGTGSVSVDGIQISGTELSSSDSTQITIKENLHVTGNISGTITGTVTGTIDADSSTVSNLEVDNFKASAIVIESEGIGSNDNDTTIPTSAAVKDYVDNNAGDTTGDLAITGSSITAPSNADLTLSAGGTGSVDIEGIQIKGTEISSADSTQVTIKENLHVTGNITGTINANQLSGTLPAISGEFLTGVAKHTFRTIQIGGGNTLVADDPVDTLTINPGTNVTITDDQLTDAFTINVNGMGDLTFNGSTIISPSNADITLDPAGTGQVVANAALKFNAGYIENINTLTSSTTITVDCSLASIHTVTLGVSTGFVITNLPTGGTVTLIITQDGSGSRTATFGTDGSSAVKFPGGAPTLSTGAGDIDVVTIINDGTNFLGNCAKNYS